jgi:hypothetical protein
MSSVNYVDIGLNSVEEYWNHVVIPNFQAFRASPTPNSTYLAALSLWHIQDWVWHDQNPGLHAHGWAFKKFRKELLKACPQLGWLQDIANAGKHHGLRYPTVVKSAASDFMPKSNMTVGEMSGFMEMVTLKLDDGSKQDVGATLQKAVDFWRDQLKAKNLPVP